MFTETFATLFGIYCILSGLVVMATPGRIEAIFDGFEDNAAMTYVAAVAIFFAGGFMAAFHNDWSGWPEIFVSLIGWLVAIKGALLMVIPAPVISLARPFLASNALLRTVGIASIVLGFVLLAPHYMGEATEVLGTVVVQ